MSPIGSHVATQGLKEDKIPNPLRSGLVEWIIDRQAYDSDQVLISARK